MKSKPSQGLMNQAEYARHRNVNRSYISRLAKRGILVMRGSLVDVKASDAVLDDRPVDVDSVDRVDQSVAQSAQARPGTEPPPQQPGSFAQAKLAEMVYRAKLRRLDYETRSGKLVSTDEVKVKWFAIGRQIRDKLLAMPAKLAPQLAALTDARDVRELMDQEITAALRALQDDIRYRRT